MTTMTVRAGSREPMLVPVAGLADDPEAAAVSVAVVECQDPELVPLAADYQPAEWVAVAGRTMARVLVGPGSDVGALDPGRYRVWVRLVLDPQDVRLDAGALTVR